MEHCSHFLEKNKTTLNTIYCVSYLHVHISDPVNLIPKCVIVWKQELTNIRKRNIDNLHKHVNVSGSVVGPVCDE